MTVAGSPDAILCVPSHSGWTNLNLLGFRKAVWNESAFLRLLPWVSWRDQTLAGGRKSRLGQ